MRNAGRALTPSRPPVGSLRAPGECSTVPAGMAEVFPFRGVRYAASRPMALSRLVAPPYDVISPAHRAELAARSPHNVVHLILPEDQPGHEGEDRYARAGRWDAEWLRDGVLQQDAPAAFYGIEQGFTGPDGRPRVRRSLVAACRVQDYAAGAVLPHEKTLTGAKADRLQILRHVGGNFSPIFGLFEDEEGEGERVLSGAIAAAGDPVAEADTDDGTHHRLWRLEDPAASRRLQEILRTRTVYIADGHHRYEASVLHRDEVDAAHPGSPPDAGHRFVMMAVCSMADPGLVIYPTHRLVGGLRSFRLGPFVDALTRYFAVDTLVEDLRRPAGRAWAVSKLAEHSGKSTTFLMVTADDGKGRILTLRDDADFTGVPLPANITVRDLDVTALHQVVFEHLLGMSPASQERGENLRYEMDAGEVVSRTLDHEYQLGFLVNPTPMWQVQAVAEAGETIPIKSTFFYPKLPSGLVMRRVHEPLGR